MEGTVTIDGEQVDGIHVDHTGPLPPPAFLGAPAASRVRSDEFATVVLEAVAANRVPLTPAPLSLPAPAASPASGAPGPSGSRGGSSSPGVPGALGVAGAAGSPGAAGSLDIAGRAGVSGAAGPAPDGEEEGDATTALIDGWTTATAGFATQIDAARMEAARSDTAQTDAIRIDTTRFDAARADVARADATRFDAARADAARADAARADGAWTETARADDARDDTDGVDVDAVLAGAAPGGVARDVAAQERAARAVHRKKAEQATEQWPPPEMRAVTQSRAATARVFAPRVAVRPKPVRHLRRPGAGLAWTLVFALLATFFAYTAAEPTWLALGHATGGTATVVRCRGAGVLRRCEADFASARFAATGVALVGADRRPGTTTKAHMVGPGSRIAYAGSGRGLRLRGLVGLVLVLLCGAGIAWATGAGRLPGPRARRWARLLSMGLPLLVAAGVLAATY